MKTLVTLCILFLASMVIGATVKVAWDDPNPPGTVLEYRLLVGTNSGIYSLTNTFPGTSGNVTNQATNVFVGRTNYFAVVAIGQDGSVSDHSNEAVKYLLSPCLILTVTMQTAMSPVGPWHNDQSMHVSIDPMDPTTFYRARLTIEP